MRSPLGLILVELDSEKEKFMNFIQALVFSLVFFGVWSLKDFFTAKGERQWPLRVVGLVFLIAGWFIFTTAYIK